MHVLVQLRSTPDFANALLAGERVAATATAAKALTDAGLSLDPVFPPTAVPAPLPRGPMRHMFSIAQPVEYSSAPEHVTHVVRGEIPDSEAQGAVLAMASAHPDVLGVFADPLIGSWPVVCPDRAVGTDRDVARNLGAPELARKGMTGKGVRVAVVDTGINVAYLRSHGRDPKLDARRSFTPAGPSTSPGRHPVNHGTMCAYDVGIAASEAKLLDHAVLLSQSQGSTTMEGLLSDAVLSYAQLLAFVGGMANGRRALVVSNSWGMFSPTWDFPPGHPGNYSDNPRHPFNIIVASLERAGADILFAAGNCGRGKCIDSRCEFGDTPPICGANSHPAVLSVAGVDVRKRRLGYSSQGPGRLSAHKPDVASFTHFSGSGVYPADGGTSAACPVLAGVVAAVRTKYSATRLSPAALRSLICKTADDLGRAGYDYDYGWGAIDAAGLTRALERTRTAGGELMAA